MDLPRTRDWLFKASLTYTASFYTMTENDEKGSLPPKIENRPPGHPPKDYAGEYINLTHGNVSIVYEESEKKDKEAGELYYRTEAFYEKMGHYHYEMFSVVWRKFAYRKKLGLRFLTDADGEVNGFALVVAPTDDEVIFKRKAVVVSSSIAVKEE
ncbi:hypothetical protein BGZ96_004121 [Linnemannia gamsii]|uniref:Peptidase S12 Pab87-related C-terminal domain-containing protein n=1 Tax=Linnemannia gamsii TaxID=64522 RepID=A0ABQ7K5Z9_9FUNG|nr:hypothetical protein BGZ96_004121 [Linnemannia gamsii]